MPDDTNPYAGVSLYTICYLLLSSFPQYLFPSKPNDWGNKMDPISVSSISMKNMSNLDLYLYSLFVYTHSQVFYYSYW